jgi:hypothetical protein
MSETKKNEQATSNVSTEQDAVSAERLQVESTDKGGLFGNTQFTDLNGYDASTCHYSCKEYRAMTNY